MKKIHKKVSKVNSLLLCIHILMISLLKLRQKNNKISISFVATTFV